MKKIISAILIFSSFSSFGASYCKEKYKECKKNNMSQYERLCRSEGIDPESKRFKKCLSYFKKNHDYYHCTKIYQDCNY